jgi:hypothetical protein
MIGQCLELDQNNQLNQLVLEHNGCDRIRLRPRSDHFPNAVFCCLTGQFKPIVVSFPSAPTVERDEYKQLRKRRLFNFIRNKIDRRHTGRLMLRIWTLILWRVGVIRFSIRLFVPIEWTDCPPVVPRNVLLRPTTAVPYAGRR